MSYSDVPVTVGADLVDFDTIKQFSDNDRWFKDHMAVVSAFDAPYRYVSDTNLSYTLRVQSGNFNGGIVSGSKDYNVSFQFPHNGPGLPTIVATYHGSYPGLCSINSIDPQGAFFSMSVTLLNSAAKASNPRIHWIAVTKSDITT